MIISVFEGGDGCTSGGRSERSSESGDLVRDEARDRCGDGMAVVISVVGCSTTICCLAVSGYCWFAGLLENLQETSGRCMS